MQWLWISLPVAFTMPFVYWIVMVARSEFFIWRRDWDTLAGLVAAPAGMWALVLYGRWTA